MRVRLSEKDRLMLFNKLLSRGFSNERIANATSVSTRMVSDWRRGKYTLPQVKYQTLLILADLDLGELTPEILDGWWYTSSAGKQGAAASYGKHGNFGTPEGRRKGGINSYQNNKDKSVSIFTQNAITEPARDEQLAEFIGILIGDGCLTKYQVAIASNTTADHEYIQFIASLICDLFDITPSFSVKEAENCTSTFVSSIKLVRFLHEQGVIIGHKLRQNLDIPTWILENELYAIACLRGIFDTDGGIFLERHNINGKLYCYPRLSFVSMSYQLRLSIDEVLTNLDFSSKIRNNRSVNLEKRSDINRYFELIGSSNPKHLNRWDKFGGVG